MNRLVYVAVALSLVACSGSKSHATAPASPATRSSAAAITSTTTTTPAAPTSTPSAASASTPSATSTTPTTPGRAPASPKPAVPDIKAQLLTLDDLPPGWSPHKITHDSSGEPACFKRLDHTGTKPLAKAEAEFQASPEGPPSLDEGITYVRKGAAADFVRAVKELNRCGNVSLKSNGTTFSGAIAGMSFPSMGDDSKAYQMTLSGVVNQVRVTVGFDVLLLRVGGDEVSVLYSTLGVPDIRDFEGAAKLVLDKIRGPGTKT